MSFAKRICFSLIPGLVFFLLLEGVCRAWEKRDPVGTYVPDPVPALPQKKPGEFRVLFYGASTVRGEQLPEVGFVRQLSYFLADQCPNVPLNFVNYAASGRSSAYVSWIMDRTVAESSADAIVVLTAHNEFVLDRDLSEAEFAAVFSTMEFLSVSAAVRRARDLLFRYLSARRREASANQNLDRCERGSKPYLKRVARYSKNLERIVRTAQEAQIPIFLCTGPSNLSNWPPAHLQYSKYARISEYQSAVRESQKLTDGGLLEDAQRSLEDAMVPFPDDAILAFLRGRVATLAGRDADARDWYYRARDWDPMPFRVLSVFNDAVRAMEGKEGVQVVDLEKIFDSRSPGGVTGFDFVADLVHPTPAGNFLIADALLKGFLECGLVQSERPPGKNSSLASFLEASGFTRNENSLRSLYLVRNGKHSMKPPYLNYSLAKSYLEQAVQLDGADWEAWANLGTALLFLGEREEGLVCLRKATEAKGEEINPDDWDAVPLLRDALRVAGLGRDALAR